MKKYSIGADICSGQCTLIVEADSPEEAVAKARGGEVLEVIEGSWEYGDIDEDTCAVYEE